MENNSDTGWCEFCPSTCTHTHRFNGHFSRWTRVSQCQLRVDVSSSFILCAFSWDRLELFIFSLTYFPSTVPPWLRSSELIRQFLSFVRHRVLFSSGVIYICPLLLSCPAFSFDPVSDLSAQSEPSTHGTTAYWCLWPSSVNAGDAVQPELWTFRLSDRDKRAHCAHARIVGFAAISLQLFQYHVSLFMTLAVTMRQWRLPTLIAAVVLWNWNN